MIWLALVPVLIWAGKEINDSIKEDERREREEKQRKAEQKRKAKEAVQKREQANVKEKKRQKEEQEKLLKNYASTQAKILLDKYKITRLTPDSLATLAISDTSNAISNATKQYMKSKVKTTLEKNVTSLEKELDDIAELEQVIKGL